MVRLTRSITRSAAARASVVTVLVLAGMAALAAVAGATEPRPWQLGLQPSATPVHERLATMHDELLVVISLITVFVLGLLLYVMILVVIAIPSFKLIYYMDRVPNADMTIKVTAHQWYWSYEYPDQAGLSFDSNLIQDKDLKPGQKRLLDVDNPLVVPVGATIRVLVTGTDVIHSWFVPSFGVQEYAIIGRLNETWMQVEHEGTYYGECNQICGVNHAFMPIAVKAVSKPEFEKWLGEAKKKFAVAPSPGIEAGATLVAAAAAGKAQPADQEPAGNR